MEHKKLKTKLQKKREKRNKKIVATYEKMKKQHPYASENLLWIHTAKMHRTTKEIVRHATKKNEI